MKLMELLDQEAHWCQGHEWITDDAGRLEKVCLMGAMRAVVLGVRIGDRVIGPSAAPTLALTVAEAAAISRLAALEAVADGVIRDLYYPGTPARGLTIGFNDLDDRAFEDVQAVAAEVDRRMALLESTA